ncbi:MAG: hypothetical protein ISS15_01015 [Alphaproteobacteria bacterium]|nr:hypothetical protein [Alphaproteobacteria bacterium]MBL7096211.1 hypothetical protein [Alphaproteobacteria bacterium]
MALTFDACEQKRPMHLDSAISDYLVARHIPFTIFLSGRFAADKDHYRLVPQRCSPIRAHGRGEERFAGFTALEADLDLPVSRW